MALLEHHCERVVHIAETIKGGIATYLRYILPLQRARYGRENIRVLVPVHQVGELDHVDVPIVPFRPCGRRLATAIVAARALRHELRPFRPTIVHIHSSFAGLTCRPLLRCTLRRPRVVYCPHGWAFVRGGSSAPAAVHAERMLSRLCDGIICVSEAGRQAALDAGLPSGKLHTILNGLPDRGSLRIGAAAGEAEALRLLFVGRLDRQKGFDVLVAALRHMTRSVSVDVFGEAVLGENAVDALPGCVRSHGWQPFSEVEPYLERCDALVMPSRWEGLPMSALEAMRAGKAVVASRVGGLPELVKDGVTGCLVPADDAFALAQVLESLRRRRLVEMGMMGRKRFLEKFRVEECEARLAELYDELLCAPVAGGGR